jgi:LPS export ABC transporter protein LptC
LETGESADIEKIEPPTAEVVTREVMMEKFDAEGTLLWSVAADRAEGELSPEGDYTKVEGVTVVIHDDGKPAFQIDADNGEVSKSTGKLDLQGEVTAKSGDGRTSLTCDRITYSVNDETLRATGNVSAESNGLSIGPAKTADAKFKNVTKNMNASTITTLVLTSLIVQGQRIHYKDNAGNMDVAVNSFKITRDTSSNLYRFSGTGSPFVARWLKQGITIRGNTLEGTFAPVAEGNKTRYELRSGKFAGNLTATVDGERGNIDMKGMSVFTIDFLTDSDRWRFTGSGSPITVTLPDSGAVITGNSFEGFATGDTTRPEWQSATISGGVRAVVTQRERNSGETYTVTATSPRVEINRSGRFVKLSGGARASGNHPAMGPGGATVESPTVTLHFDAEMKEVTGVDFE